MNDEKREKIHELLDYCLNNGMCFKLFVAAETSCISVDTFKWERHINSIINHNCLDVTSRNFAERVDEVINDDKS